MTPISQQIDELSAIFARDGCVKLTNVVSKPRLAALAEELQAEFARAKANGELFSGGGMISGHLNCFPGAQSRFVYDELEASGVFDFVRRLSPTPLRKPNIGCNFNLPNSSPQNPHVDGYASAPFFIVNVAPVDTDIENGAMEAAPGTHLREYKYWQYVLSGKPAIRMRMNAGDVVVRISTMWHRGMPNRSKVARPMLAFSWEDGGSKLEDPYSVHGGKITFLTNRYGQSLADRVRERAFATVPSLGSSYLFVRSLIR
jgi:hypothetical protein